MSASKRRSCGDRVFCPIEFRECFVSASRRIAERDVGRNIVVEKGCVFLASWSSRLLEVFFPPGPSVGLMLGAERARGQPRLGDGARLARPALSPSPTFAYLDHCPPTLPDIHAVCWLSRYQHSPTVVHRLLSTQDCTPKPPSIHIGHPSTKPYTTTCDSGNTARCNSRGVSGGLLRLPHAALAPNR